jgi:hypothetical protein
MIEGHIIFNAILYSIVIAYILYINFSAYYQTGTGFLKALVNLFQNWIFRTVYLLIVGFFALDLFPYGGFVLAILLTIAFLNTNMLVYKKDVEESFTMNSNNEKKKDLPSDGTVGGTAPTTFPAQNVSAPTTFPAQNVSAPTAFAAKDVSAPTAFSQNFPAGTPQIPPAPPQSSFATQQPQ